MENNTINLNGKIFRLVPVEEKNYQILEIDGYGGLYTLRSNGKFIYCGLADKEDREGYTAEQLFNEDVPKKYFIKSVKYLLTGEVIRLGDILQGIGRPFRVEKFEIIRDVCYVTGQGASYAIGNIKKVKAPIRKTVDYKDIFEGDRPFVLAENSIYQWGLGGITNGANKDLKLFLSKENALNFQNKLISRKELLSALDELLENQYIIPSGVIKLKEILGI